MSCAALVAFVVFVGLARLGGTTRPSPLTAADVTAAVPGLEVTAIGEEPPRLAMRTWRDPVLTLWPTGFRLDMHYNGLDDHAWPFTRILDALLAKACGGVREGWSLARVTQLYASRSLVPMEDLGGNGGRSFRKVAAATAGRCRLELLAEGGRWHDLTARVFY